ncbi:4Fe-4S binding protein [Methanococcoides sp.]|uniref:4Fe-4S binding protein n=1 Tax=Methanococcoides sp. TaxID=1966350 RepID=UPI001A013E2E|nr:4Fe-4S binding protein [Methanococcoides sp.]NOQ48696.1 4Fe-4S dicluster domain-containing protein [Methanococcoides sp.]
MVRPEGLLAIIGCNNCGKCALVCSHGALQRHNGRVTIDHDLCILCMDCAEVCPIKAIVYIE